VVFTVAAHARVQKVWRHNRREGIRVGAAMPSPEELGHVFHLRPDLDDDGLWNDEEIALGPILRPGHDDDGLLDARSAHLSDRPLKADTDADGLTDGKSETYLTDPLNPDTERDASRMAKRSTPTTRIRSTGYRWRLVDRREEAKTYATDPLNADTDGDA